MAEWLKVGLPVLAAILSAYVMIQGHDIKINRLESDMKIHTDEHKKETKDAYDKLSRIEIAIERIETKVESLKGR
jgi:archaellum component FlaC